MSADGAGEMAETDSTGTSDAPQPESLSRPISAELDSILGAPFRVLDDGFVRVVDYMGNDTSVVQSVRVSYGVGTKRVHEDRGLIRYLMRHQHTTPFEMCEIKLHVRSPMDVWRQWIRHRTANVNEYSTRYSIAIDSAQLTPPDRWRRQSLENRQGSGEYLSVDAGEALSDQERSLQQEVRRVYEARLDAGVAREQARKDLPLSTYTEAYWKIDLHNLLNFLWLRMDGHAQAEIRAYACTIGEQIVARWVPVVWEAFVDYRQQSVQLTRIESAVIEALIAGDSKRAVDAAANAGLLKVARSGELLANRERKELETKVRRFGLKLPW